MSILSGIETISNHGTVQGILPRFYWQTLELAEMAIGKAEAEEKLNKFLTENIPDFTNFYDIHQEINTEYNEYLDGLMNGKYFSKNDNGEFKIDRSPEFRLDKKIKDFFIYGKLLINNFAKSKLIDIEQFVLNNLAIVSDSNFKKHKLTSLEDEKTKQYEVLFIFIEKARTLFLNEFNNIRNNLEHQNFQVPKFKIDTLNNTITDPSINGKYILIDEINYYYENILDLVELLIAFRFGIQASQKKPILGLYFRENHDFTKMISKFCILPRFNMKGMELIY